MKREKNNSLLYLKFFIFAALLVIFLGIIIRLFNQYQNREFVNNSYNLLIISDKYVGIIGIDSLGSSFSAIAVTKDLENLKRENILLQSINFGIPIHGYVVYPKGEEPYDPTPNFLSWGNIQNILSDPSIKKKNITFFDWMKLYSERKKIASENTIIKSYATITDVRGLLSKESDLYFQNSEIVNEKTSLQIVNGTRVNGLGNRIGEMYSRVGFNVVSIVTEQGRKDSEILYSNKLKSDQAELIQKSFNFPITYDEDAQIADITIIIGEESELELENLMD